nr:hypothetical protein CFP56_58144 [Quercus suber]
MLPKPLALRQFSQRVATISTFRLPSTSVLRNLQTLHRPRTTIQRFASHTPFQTLRYVSAKSLADEKIEQITELYSTAQDEFEIALEETEKQTVYAEEDRKAAREELERVKEAYRLIVEGTNDELAEEVKRRIGQRIRELEHGVMAMEELAQHQD